ncbi:unnamed protein product [Amaranthus hypochondriacus]
MSSMEPSFSTSDSQNWLELPRDVMLMILMKLDTIEILENAQFVCKLWYDLCKDPSIWRIVMMQNVDEPELAFKYEKMLYSAVDRSSGGLIKLDIEGFGGDELISNIYQRCSQLKQLRLACCYSISANAIIRAIEKFPLLEELDITLCAFTGNQTVQIIQSCPSLTTFKLNEQGSRNPTMACDDEALAIATSMPKLHVLQLVGNSLTDKGLKAILYKCPHLQSLDLRACFHVNFDGDLWKRCCAQIKDIRRPCDSTDDYNYLTTDYDSDFDEIYADEYDDMDFMSDDDYYDFSPDDDVPFYEDY